MEMFAIAVVYKIISTLIQPNYLLELTLVLISTYLILLITLLSNLFMIISFCYQVY